LNAAGKYAEALPICRQVCCGGEQPLCGNPLLDGAQDDPVWGPENKKRAELARTKRCTHIQQVAVAHGPSSVRSFASMFRGIQADIEQIRYQAPLPESADELCEVARRLGVPESDILF